MQARIAWGVWSKDRTALNLATPGWYADTDYKVTVVYRRLDDLMLEDNCSEGIWLEALEATAVEQ